MCLAMASLAMRSAGNSMLPRAKEIGRLPRIWADSNPKPLTLHDTTRSLEYSVVHVNTHQRSGTASLGWWNICSSIDIRI
jgi:hypothetical protein